MKSYLLGLDVGTGGTLALLIGKDGAIISSATREHQPFASPHNGWAEQDWPWLHLGLPLRFIKRVDLAVSSDNTPRSSEW
jgi:sugar (pentulose or hexulose) kinase